MRNLVTIAAILLIYLLLSILVFSPRMPPTGDEPHYLITMHSLAVDGDISLLNNYQERQYRVFYPGQLAKRTTLSADKSEELPAFGPGIAFLLLPFYKLALFFFPGILVPFLRSVISVIAAFAFYQLIRAAEIFAESKLNGSLILPAFALASPLVTYCAMFYPEIIAFLFIVLALRFLFDFDNHTVRSTIALTLLSPALLWLHPKYLVLSALLFFIGAYKLFRLLPKRPGLQAFHAGLTLLGIFSFFFFLNEFYGSWSPNRIYGGVQRETSLLDLVRGLGWERIGIMFRMIPAYWLDQRFGIIPYAPVYIMSISAFVWMARNHFYSFLPAMILFAGHFFVISWGAQMGGYAPPSRHFVVLLPILIFPVFVIMEKLRLLQKMIMVGFSCLGWVITIVIVTHYRSIFTNATWRNPDGLSEFWSLLGLAGSIPQLTMKEPKLLLALAWAFLVTLFASLLYPRSIKHG